MRQCYRKKIVSQSTDGIYTYIYIHNFNIHITMCLLFYINVTINFQNLYKENCKTLLRDIKVNLNYWKCMHHVLRILVF